MSAGVNDTQLIRMGMVGGGHVGSIGSVHRMAARLDGQIDLVCGVFSRDKTVTDTCGAQLGVKSDRLYKTYEDMFAAEAQLPSEKRMQFVSIITPNDTHYAIANTALKYGFHVLSDKPATLDLGQAQALRQHISNSGLCYGLTHTYVGYPMVIQARHMVASGALGQLRKILIEYPQSWLVDAQENKGHKGAAWRTDPAFSGLSGCMADIGTHAHNLVEYVTGQIMTHVCADLNSFGQGRRLDDDGSVLFRMDGGAKGVLTASQICAGEDNGLKIRVYGELGGLEWRQLAPNYLQLKMQGQPVQIWAAGKDKNYLCSAARRACRLPGGHPDGYLEAFANLYRTFAGIIRQWPESELKPDETMTMPGIEEGVRGMAFIEALVNNAQGDVKWTQIYANETGGRHSETD